MIEFPPAKLDLGLQIIAKRTDGFHDLQTVFYQFPLNDVLEIIKDWSLMNVYLDLIWAYVMNKVQKGSIKDNYISGLELKLDYKSNK